jgi:hypothetical protein
MLLSHRHRVIVYRRESPDVLIDDRRALNADEGGREEIGEIYEVVKRECPDASTCELWNEALDLCWLLCPSLYPSPHELRYAATR